MRSWSQKTMPIHMWALLGNYFSQHGSYEMTNIFVLLNGCCCRLLAPAVDFWLLPFSLATAWLLRQAGSTNLLFLQANPIYQFQKK